tara:strand:- start:1213 stop:2259 length:1047 start_codon:yes stop_codon:yes gene_type:complete
LKKRSVLKKGVGTVVSLALLLGIVSPYVPLHISAIPSYFGLVFPLTFFLALIVAIFSARDFWKMKVFFSLLIVSSLFVQRFINLSSSVQTSEGIQVLCFNLRGGYSIVDKNKKQEASNLKELKHLLMTDIDIVMLQEVNKRVTNWTEDYFPFKNIVTSKRSGTLIASNYEIVDSGEIDFETKVNSCVWSDLQTPHGIIRVYNVHFQSSKIYDDTEKAIAEGREYNPDVFTSIQSIMNKYRKQGLIRIEQAEKVKAHIRNCPYEVLLGGDFNETPMSYTYQIMKETFHDHFNKSTGYGATYPQSSPLLRIDYIMSSKNIRCERFEIMRNISLSDHLPILSTIEIKNTPE